MHFNKRVAAAFALLALLGWRLAARNFGTDHESRWWVNLPAYQVDLYSDADGELTAVDVAPGRKPSPTATRSVPGPTEVRPFRGGFGIVLGDRVDEAIKRMPQPVTRIPGPFGSVALVHEDKGRSLFASCVNGRVATVSASGIAFSLLGHRLTPGMSLADVLTALSGERTVVRRLRNADMFSPWLSTATTFADLIVVGFVLGILTNALRWIERLLVHILVAACAGGLVAMLYASLVSALHPVVGGAITYAGFCSLPLRGSLVAMAALVSSAVVLVVAPRRLTLGVGALVRGVGLFTAAAGIAFVGSWLSICRGSTQGVSIHVAVFHALSVTVMLLTALGCYRIFDVERTPSAQSEFAESKDTACQTPGGPRSSK